MSLCIHCPSSSIQPIPEIVSSPEDTSESSREESQSDSAESLLVPNGYSSKESVSGCVAMGLLLINMLIP